MPFTHHLDATAGQLTVVGSGPSDFRETEAAIRWPAASVFVPFGN